MIICIVVVIAVVCWATCWKMDEKREREESWVLPADHLEGLEGVAYKDYISLVTKKELLHIEVKIKINGQTMILPFKQIVQVNFITWEKTITKPLNPMAEAAVTGLIAGEAMGVAAAIDAKGRTRSEKVTVKDALEIQYHPKGDFRTIKSIIVDPGSPKSHGQKWAKMLCRCANLPGPNFVEPKEKGPTYL